jgi:DNA-binding CsgD family transcriptional regulator
MSDGARFWALEAAEDSVLTERQAKALYRRQDGQTRQQAAEAMNCSPSNIDNLEREARAKIRRASNTVAIADSIGAAEPRTVGTCGECDEPTSSLSPDPDDDNPLEDRRLLCGDCR